MNKKPGSGVLAELTVVRVETPPEEGKKEAPKDSKETPKEGSTNGEG